MYQCILNLLKAKFVGVSENILSRIANKLAQTAIAEEQAQASVDAYTLQQVIDSYADHRATEASQTAVKNYEQKWGLKDGEKQKPVETPNNGGANADAQPIQQKVADETPAWAKSLLEANKALNERLNKMEGERTTGNRKKQISSVVSKLPEQLRKPYELIQLDSMSEEQFKNMIGEITSQVDETAKGLSAKGAVFNPPSNPGGNDASGELSKQQQEAIAHREGNVAEGSQPF